jgi:hypothetical protein
VRRSIGRGVGCCLDCYCEVVKGERGHCVELKWFIPMIMCTCRFYNEE